MSVVLNHEPSPKFQFHESGLIISEVSVNCTVRGTVPDVGLAVKCAWGTGPPDEMTMVPFVLVSLLILLSAKITGVKVPVPV